MQVSISSTAALHKILKPLDSKKSLIPCSIKG
jgi:hypothetical protein